VGIQGRDKSEIKGGRKRVSRYPRLLKKIRLLKSPTGGEGAKRKQGLGRGEGQRQPIHPITNCGKDSIILITLKAPGKGRATRKETTPQKTKGQRGWGGGVQSHISRSWGLELPVKSRRQE